MTTLSCKAQNLIIQDTSNLGSQNSALINYFSEIEIFQDIENMHDFVISLNEETGQMFVVGRGTHSDGSSVVFRTPVSNTDGIISLAADGSGSESCSGVACEYCTFAKKGGCDPCKRQTTITNGEPYCKHTITRPTSK